MKYEPQDIYNGRSHSFDTGIAEIVGLNAAIVFNHILYWLSHNASKKDSKTIDGKYWMYETQQEIADFLRYLTVEEVKKCIVKLLDCGLLIKANYNDNKFNKTNWYTVFDQSLITNNSKENNRIKKTLSKEPYGAIDSSLGRDPKSPTAPSYNVQEEQQEEEHVCYVDQPPVGVDPLVKTVVLKDCKGKSTEVSKEDLFKVSIQKRKDWTEKEIEFAWDVMINYTDPISDWIKFIDGTIQNSRKVKKVKSLDKTKKQQMPKQEPQKIIQPYVKPEVCEGFKKWANINKKMEKKNE